MLPAALHALAAHRNFILYRKVARPTGKTDKLPCSPHTAQVIDAHDPQHWTDAATAYSVAALLGPEFGVGFVLTSATRLWCLDIDNCLTPSGWSAQALELCKALPGACEVSQSGRGLHIWGSGAVPAHGCKNTALGIELYTDKRFIALGQPNAVGNAAVDLSAPLAAVVARYFTPSAQTAAPTDWTDRPCAEWRGPADDDALIARMLAAKPSTASMFSGRANVADLWTGNTAVLAATYPATGSTDTPYDASSVDAALASHLAWWTGRDCERMRRLMMRSALRREKWEREDYLPRTIQRACSMCTTVYQERQADLPGSDPAPTDDDPAIEPTTHIGRRVEGTSIATPDDQIRLWAGFTYITDANVILTAKGQMLDQSQFKNRYGGCMYTIDDANGKMTDNAWEAFTHSRAIRMPKVDHSAFRPDLDPGYVWEQDDESFVNSYRRLSIPRAKGDVSLFLRHLELVLPVKRDRDILLAYMAAVVQHQGVKFQWAPLIQGVEGNGKTLFSRCVAEAVGMRYSHMPRASELAEKFNDWLVGKIFIGVEDVYWPEGRTEIIETLKPMITNNRLPIRAMRRSEQNMDICANFIVNSNHRDAIKKTTNDRRWCIMFCAQQSAEDLTRDGMNDAYFQRLYGWLNQGGYAAVSEFLYTYQIPAEFGLDCLLSRAPVTSSTEEAVTLSLGRVEQEVQEAIEQGLPGFANGWTSSLALDKLLKENRMDALCPRAKRVDLMRSLGWVHHPALRGGRSTACLPGTRDRPIFYIREGSAQAQLRTSQEIIQAYLAAQAPGVVMMGVGT